MRFIFDGGDEMGDVKRVVICPNCGALSEIDENVEGEDWLACMPLPIEIAQIPAGKISLVSGVTQYVDGNGAKYSREDYIKMHGIDPEVVWNKISEYRNKRSAFKIGGR